MNFGRLLAVLIAIGVPVFFFYIFEGRNGLPPRPHIARMHPLAPTDTQSNRIVVKDTAWHTIPPFAFTDQRLRTITQATVANKMYVAAFVSTNSPLAEALGNNLRRLNLDFNNDTSLYLLLHTLDPQHDTTAQMHHYADQYETDSSRQFMLTGSLPLITRQATQGYRIPLPQHTTDTLATLQAQAVLVDRQGIVRGYYRAADAADFNRLMVDIRVLALEYPRARQKFEVRPKP